MSRIKYKYFFAFILGMFGFVIGYLLISTIIFVDRPNETGIIEDWKQICFRGNESNIFAIVYPKGCYSTTCTRPRLQTGTAIIGEQEIRLETTFLLVETSSFPFPCNKNCAGGGSVQFDLGNLKPNDIVIWFRNEKVGELKILSKGASSDQCFDNLSG